MALIVAEGVAEGGRRLVEVFVGHMLMPRKCVGIRETRVNLPHGSQGHVSRKHVRGNMHVCACSTALKGEHGG
jgi:hypothetical protein